MFPVLIIRKIVHFARFCDKLTSPHCRAWCHVHLRMHRLFFSYGDLLIDAGHIGRRENFLQSDDSFVVVDHGERSSSDVNSLVAFSVQGVCFVKGIHQPLVSMATGFHQLRHAYALFYAHHWEPAKRHTSPENKNYAVNRSVSSLHTCVNKLSVKRRYYFHSYPCAHR